LSSTNRQKMILSFLEEHDSVNVNELSEYFHVTPTSIRRDLTSLEEAGWIIRSRGQAQLNNKSFRSGLLNTAFNKRTSINSSEKKILAKLAASMIKPRDTVFLDSGTTIHELAAELKHNPIKDITIITNAVPAATLLAPDYTVNLSGGVLNSYIMALIGPDAENYFSHVIAHKAFIGASSIIEQGITSTFPFHVGIKRKVITQSKEVYVVVDSTKFIDMGVHIVCSLRDLTAIITIETDENKEALKHFREEGIKIITV
jgi:DeoR family fructose operon transcriptional repressor